MYADRQIGVLSMVSGQQSVVSGQTLFYPRVSMFIQIIATEIRQLMFKETIKINGK